MKILLDIPDEYKPSDWTVFDAVKDALAYFMIPVNSVERVTKVQQIQSAFSFLCEGEEKNETGFINFYECEKCGEKWQDEWSCACDDRCPVCDIPMTPYRSEDSLGNEINIYD